MILKIDKEKLHYKQNKTYISKKEKNSRPKTTKEDVKMSAFSVTFNCITVILVIGCVNQCISFNLSPKPNFVLREPKLSSVGMPKMRSSYFGFSINLKQNR